MRRNITLKPGSVSKNRDATSRQDFAQWRETCTCLHVDITDEVKPANSCLVAKILVLCVLCFSISYLYILELSNDENTMDRA